MRLNNIVFFGLLWAMTFNASAIVASDLTITSPANGATISGGTIPIIVQPGPKVNCNKIIVITEGIGLTSLTTPPFQGSIALPNGYSGATKLRALCTTASNTIISSSIVSVTIDSGIAYAAIKVYPSSLHFSRVGQQVQMNIQGIDSNGQDTTITQSPRISYISDDNTIATITNTGLATANKSGSTIIRVKIGELKQDIKVLVPKSMRGDVNGDGQVDIDDINILTSDLNNPANSPNDARDLNHDGKIDEKDVEILKTLCTFPNCATHP